MFASGRVAELILGLVVLEGLALAAYHRATGRGVPPGRLAGNLASGGALLLALRLALGGAWWGWIGLCLFASLLAHAADLRARWRREGA